MRPVRQVDKNSILNVVLGSHDYSPPSHDWWS